MGDLGLALPILVLNTLITFLAEVSCVFFGGIFSRRNVAAHASRAARSAFAVDLVAAAENGFALASSDAASACIVSSRG